jgi:hypothetical protein
MWNRWRDVLPGIRFFARRDESREPMWGKHVELLAQGGLYARLHEIQFRVEERLTTPVESTGTGA